MSGRRKAPARKKKPRVPKKPAAIQGFSKGQLALLKAILAQDPQHLPGTLHERRFWKALQAKKQEGLGRTFVTLQEKGTADLWDLQLLALGCSDVESLKRNDVHFEEVNHEICYQLFQQYSPDEAGQSGGTSKKYSNTTKACIWLALAISGTKDTEQKTQYLTIFCQVILAGAQPVHYKQLLTCLLAAYVGAPQPFIIDQISLMLLRAIQLSPSGVNRVITEFESQQNIFNVGHRPEWAYILYGLSTLKPLSRTQVRPPLSTSTTVTRASQKTNADVFHTPALAQNTLTSCHEVPQVSQNAVINQKALACFANLNICRLLMENEALLHPMAPLCLEEAIAHLPQALGLATNKYKVFRSLYEVYILWVKAKFHQEKKTFKTRLDLVLQFSNQMSKLKHAAAMLDEADRRTVPYDIQREMHGLVMFVVEDYNRLTKTEGDKKQSAVALVNNTLAHVDLSNLGMIHAVSLLALLRFEQEPSGYPIDLIFKIINVCDTLIEPPYKKAFLDEYILGSVRAGWQRLASYYAKGLGEFPQDEALSRLYSELAGASDPDFADHVLAIVDYFISNKDNFPTNAYSCAHMMLAWIMGEERLTGNDEAYRTACHRYVEITLDRGYGLRPDGDKGYCDTIQCATALIACGDSEGLRMSERAWQKRHEIASTEASREQAAGMVAVFAEARQAGELSETHRATLHEVYKQHKPLKHLFKGEGPAGSDERTAVITPQEGGGGSQDWRQDSILQRLRVESQGRVIAAMEKFLKLASTVQQRPSAASALEDQSIRRERQRRDAHATGAMTTTVTATTTTTAVTRLLHPSS